MLTQLAANDWIFVGVFVALLFVALWLVALVCVELSARAEARIVKQADAAWRRAQLDALTRWGH